MRRTILGLALAASCASVAHAAVLPSFPPGSEWTRDYTGVTPDTNSTLMLNTLAGLGGWGNGNVFQIDFGFRVVHAAAGAPTRSIIELPSAMVDPNDAYYTTDCEPLGSTVPVPANAQIEGQAGTTCTNLTDDCHLLVVQGTDLYEVYRANVTAQGLEAQCLAKWDLTRVYPIQGRGEHCTSADAAGFPISALLFNADEVAAGHIDHAIRFILPNPRMARDNSLGGVSGRLYVHPATHAGGPTGPVNTVPYGVRLRLKAGYDISGFSANAQVILTAMKKYGIVLADGGNIALTAEDDVYTTAKWADLGIDSQSLIGVQVTDFEVMPTPEGSALTTRIAETYDCVRTTFPTDVLFQDGFE